MIECLRPILKYYKPGSEKRSFTFALNLERKFSTSGDGCHLPLVDGAALLVIPLFSLNLFKINHRFMNYITSEFVVREVYFKIVYEY